MSVRPTNNLISFFGGRSVSTSVFRRRSRKGRRIWNSQNRGYFYRVESLDEVGLDGGFEVGVEDVGGGEDGRHEEVQKRPEFVEVVLERRTCDEETVLGVELSHDDGERALFVLDAVSLVDHHIEPLHAAQRRLLSQHHLVAGNENVERARFDVCVDDLGARLAVALKHYHTQTRTPFGELAAPVGERGFGDNYDMWA